VKAEKQAALIKQMELHHQSNLHETKEELLQLVQKEVEKMSHKLQAIYHLSYDEGLSPAQIAENLRVSVQTVSNQKTNILKSLKKALAQHTSLMFVVLVMDTIRHLLR
jgi:RNA polymerase sigma-70 factor (ECF subfamily)